MKLLSPTPHKRLNEVAGFVFLSLGITALLSLVSYSVEDPSWNTASDARPLNLVGYPGAWLADFLFQSFGVAAFLFPLIAFLLAWKWVRSEDVEAPFIKIVGTSLLVASLCGGFSLWAVQDLNLWPPACKAGALPAELTALHAQVTQALA